jgi:2-dehydro-3-deoxyphosphogluconate aldolase/(4S)-4-hydroxy-2-oxoglutarate aldolase
LVKGGLLALEVTLRTREAFAAIAAMAAVPGAVVGAGTVLNPDDLRRAKDAGAQFIVSPGLTDRLVRAASDEGLPLLAGVATATDLMRGLDLGLDRFKFFPAAAAGGPALLKAFMGPFPRVRFCPTGGISLATAKTYLEIPNVACIGGSWVAPPSAVEQGDWDAIETLAREAAALRAPA